MKKKLKIAAAEKAGLDFIIAKKESNPAWIGDENPYPQDLSDDAGNRDEHEVSVFM